MDQQLPDDMSAEVLSKLPAKSLYRFRCVSKSWYALICPHFIRFNYNHQKFFILSDYHCSILDCYVCGPSSPYKIHRLSFPPSYAACTIRASCDYWFLCVFSDPNDYGLLVLLNPFTGESKQVERWLNNSFFPFPWRDYAFGIFCNYSCNDNGYKVLKIRLEKGKHPLFFTVFSPKTNSWTTNRSCPDWVLNIINVYGTTTSGVPHWFCRFRNRNNNKRVGILRYDSKEDEFVELPRPDGWYQADRDAGLVCLRGNLCAYSSSDQGELSVWEMKEYGVQESWTRMCRINRGPDRRYSYLSHPMAFTEKGELIVTAPVEDQIVIYNIKDDSSQPLMPLNERGWNMNSFPNFPIMDSFPHCSIMDSFPDCSITLNCDCLSNRGSLNMEVIKRKNELEYLHI